MTAVQREAFDFSPEPPCDHGAWAGVDGVGHCLLCPSTSADVLAPRLPDPTPVVLAAVHTDLRGQCVVVGCDLPVRRKHDGLCNAHRLRFDKHGTTEGFAKIERARVYEAISRQVRSAEALESGPCWPWPLGARGPKGYGAWYAGGRDLLATRVIYEMVFGPLALDECVCHRCDNPPCYRPSHLFAGTRGMNTRDAAAKRLFPPRHGQRNSQAKVTDAQAAEIAALVAAGQRTAQLAIDYGISPSQVQRIARGVRGKPTFLGRREVALTDLPIPPITR